MAEQIAFTANGVFCSVNNVCLRLLHGKGAVQILLKRYFFAVGKIFLATGTVLLQ